MEQLVLNKAALFHCPSTLLHSEVSWSMEQRPLCGHLSEDAANRKATPMKPFLWLMDENEAKQPALDSPLILEYQFPGSGVYRFVLSDFIRPLQNDT